MDQRIADGLARGRVQFRAGKRTVAVTTWKEALRVAYEGQNQAAAFVLSKSLGDAALESSHTSTEGLQEAVGYYEYALHLLDACSLREEHAFYPPLESVVQYIRRRRRRARRLLRERETPQVETKSVAADHELPAPAQDDHTGVAASLSKLCSTCEISGSKGNPLIMDEADGCLYCQSCYDEFYAQERAFSETADDHGLHPALAEKQVYSAEDLRALNARVASDAQGDPDAETQLPLDTTEENGEAIHDREAAAESTEPISTSISGRDVRTHYGKPVDTDLTPTTHEDAPVGGGDTEPTAPPSSLTPSKFVYSIADLKALRHVNLPCPPALKHSQVAISNANLPASTHSRNQKPPSRKDKPVQRPGKPPPASVDSVSALTPSKPSSSLLPSLAQCEALRATMTTLPPPLGLAQAFFETPGEAQASSFTSQLRILSSTA